MASINEKWKPRHDNDNSNKIQMSGNALNLLRRQTLNPKSRQDRDVDITMNQVDSYYCRFLYCPSCSEIYHDRNFPVNLPFCIHFMCQHCVKVQLMKQITHFERKKSLEQQFKIYCLVCQKFNEYRTLESLQNSISYNFEVLTLVYKHRALIADKANQIYDLPYEDKTSIEILQVKKFGFSVEMKERLQQEQKLLQKLNFVFIQQQRQQNLLTHLREEVVCFKCFKSFDEKERTPMIMIGCQHKLCKPCYQKFFNDKDEKVYCLFCGSDREVKSVSKTMQKWLIFQGKKKKIVLKQEIEELVSKDKPKIAQLEKILSGAKKEEEKKLDDSIVIKMGKIGTGMVASKTNVVEDEDMDHEKLAKDSLQKRQRSQRFNTYRTGLNSSEQRQIYCTTCGDIFCKLNRPILIQKCPCNVVHLQCELCFKTQTLVQSSSKKTKFKLACPITYQKIVLNSHGFTNKDQLFEHFLEPKNRDIIRVNQKLLIYVYESHPQEAIAGEREFTQQHGLDLDEEEKAFGDHDGEDDLKKKQQVKVIRNDDVDCEDIEVFVDQKFGNHNKLARLDNDKDFDRQKHCCQCNFDFSTGKRGPALLKCGHNVCLECLENFYNDDSAFEENELSVKCIYDAQTTQFLKPAFYEDANQGLIKGNFEEFCAVSVCINSGLLQLLVKHQSDKSEIIKKQLNNDYAYDFFEDDEDQIRQKNSLKEQNSNAIKQSEKIEETKQTPMSELLYDIECPICLLCYTNDNPPINLHCSEHPEHPFVLCKNEMMYYLMKAGHEKDMIVSCPICHNEIEFQSKGKTDEQFIKMLDINMILLKTIYSDNNLIEYVKNEEAQLKK